MSFYSKKFDWQTWLVLCLFSFCSLGLFVRMHHAIPGGGQVDFNHVYLAARLYNDGQLEAIYGNKPYGNERHEHWMRLEQDLPDGVFDNFYTYLPAYIIPYTHLVKHFTYRQLVDGHFYINLILSTMILAGLVNRLRMDLLHKSVLVALLSCSNIPLTILTLGQNILFCAIFIWLFNCAVLRRRIIYAAFFLSMAVLCKSWAIIFLIFPVLRRQYKCSLVCAIGIGALVLLQLLWEPQLLLAYFKLLHEFSRITYIAPGNLSFIATLRNLSLPALESSTAILEDEGLPVYIRVLQFLVLGVVGLIAWVANRISIKYMACLIAVFGLINVFWDFYFILALPVFVSVAREYARRTRSQSRFWYYHYLALLFVVHTFPMLYYVDLLGFFYRRLSPEVAHQVFRAQCFLPMLTLFISFGLLVRFQNLRLRDFKRRLLDFKPKVG